jgi:dephospho-CoA kinase
LIAAGLTGGIATGKSTVGRFFASHGCLHMDADEVGRGLLLPDGAAYGSVVREFGESILDAAGHISRPALARLVFQQPERLKVLNQIVHPLVFQIRDKWMEEARQHQPQSILIYEAAILIESGGYRAFPWIILTSCPPQLQLARAAARGMNEADARARIERQMPDAERRKFAHYVIDTSGTEADTLAGARRVLEQLQDLLNQS